MLTRQCHVEGAQEELTHRTALFVFIRARQYAMVADSMEEEEAGGNDALMMRDDHASMLESVNEKRSAVIVINAEGVQGCGIVRLAEVVWGWQACCSPG